MSARVDSLIASQYSRRIGAALVITLCVTLFFGAVFAAHVATTPGAGLAGIAGTLFVVVLNLGLLGLVLAGNVAVELRQLTDAAAEIEDGDLDASPDIDRADEFGQLSTAFDNMRDSLSEALSESETARQEAEQARREAESAQVDAEAFNEELLDEAEAIGDAMAAAADGDFSRVLSTDADVDAVDRIADAYEQMTVDLSGTVTEIRSFATSVERTSEAVAEEAAEVERLNESLAADIRELADDIEAQAENLQRAVAEVNDLSATIEEVASTTDEVAQRATDAASRRRTSSTRSRPRPTCWRSTPISRPRTPAAAATASRSSRTR